MPSSESDESREAVSPTRAYQPAPSAGKLLFFALAFVGFAVLVVGGGVVLVGAG
ncbi:hypothetical protein OKJ48_36395 [Streptomyces kunmingensis]|uniref:Uncharacterized protein n=1 Tax=Streptomyces kunmingensis TaxID=68225 RepID=A0ABU6CLQ2_9ACTN|nr:hypothetical protein [Streptomyces kunmingensis]MEB3965664.1 hypothetical protein [Streptomyces kunmingensis]